MAVIAIFPAVDNNISGLSLAASGFPLLSNLVISSTGYPLSAGADTLWFYAVTDGEYVSNV
jgi:hypothetical protein